MSEARELFADLRTTFVDQGVPVPETWEPEPDAPTTPVAWHMGNDAGGGALFEAERTSRGVLPGGVALRGQLNPRDLN